MKKILMPFSQKGVSLKNHLVMAPMTRSRAVQNIPNQIMADYYQQRASAGLIITEGTAPSPDGLGYARMPGIYSLEQVSGWKAVTHAVHQRGGHIFVQLMHSGRIGHKDNLPKGARLVGPSGIKAKEQIFTDHSQKMQDCTAPAALQTDEIKQVVSEFVAAARNAVAAGFDGIELHGANGYLLEQFLNPYVNNRTDAYGGTIENRSRLLLEIAAETARAIGKEKVGIRLSPYSTLHDLPSYEPAEVHRTYEYLATALQTIGIAYLHISAHPDLPQQTFATIRANFSNLLILCNGLTPETAEDIIQKGKADLVAFGRNFLANPDLVERITEDAPFNLPNYPTFYTPGANGYTDYPFLN